ncbi:MAG: TonB-dependent receptor [Parasphingorhabdus sp.]|uniref:TonB-dependent receptor n=1 Tax=Parasphingorhabdus sp. TaxID=2709688 RepID=UPI003000FCAA
MKSKRQPSFKYRNSAGTISLVLMLAAPSIANAQVAGEENAEDGNVIVVTGSIVAAQGASVEAKRKAHNLVDVAAADSVGRFPDQNSAAALSRLPAVAVQRDQGQERYIQVRGAPNRWTSVSIDGIPMIGVDEGGDTRAYRFDAVPAVLLSSLVINKSLTPDLTAEAIVANIDLQSYSPFDQSGFHVSGDLGYGFMDQGGGEQRQGSLRVSWSDDRFGVVAGGSHYRRKQITDNREVGAYDEQTNDTDATFGPTEFDIRQYELERWNNGLFAGVEFRPSDGVRLFGTTIFTEFSDNEQRNQYELRLDRAVSGVRNLDDGDLVGVPLRGSFNFGEYRNRNFINLIGGEYEDGDGLKISGKFNYTRTENSSYLPLVQSSTAGLDSPSITYDRSDPRFPVVTLYQTVDDGAGNLSRGPLLDISPQTLLSVPGAILIAASQETVSDSYTAKLDFSKEMENISFAAGALYVDRKVRGNNFSFANVAYVGALGGTVGQAFDVNSYVTDRPWDTQFPLGFTLNYVDNVALRRDIDTLLPLLQAAGQFDPSQNVPITDRYAQDEKLVSGYAMATFDIGSASIVAGARIEHYELDNAGTVVSDGVATALAINRSDTDIFPSINARFDLGENFVARLSGQRGVSRPAYGAIRVGASINDTASPGTISGGNPGLQSEYTWGVDGSLEYYLPGNGILSVAAFYRWVNNPFYQSEQAVGSSVFNSGDIDRSNYLLTSTFNGENGRLYGVEFNYQQQFTFLPSPLDGFGFQGNVTFLDGQFDTQEINGVQATDIAFQGLSDTIANASFYYEKYGLSARVSYQWRSDWLDTLGGTGSGEFRKGYENLDISLRYAINENLTVFADAANLTDALYIAYEGDSSRPSEVEQIGSRYLFGLRFSY